jgi:hypothetical protein
MDRNFGLGSRGVDPAEVEAAGSPTPGPAAQAPIGCQVVLNSRKSRIA